MYKPDVVVFDLGKVLIDFDYGIAARRLSEKSRVQPDEIRRLLDHNQLLIRFETGRISREQFFEELKAGSGFQGSFEDFEPLFSDIFSPIDEMIRLHDALRSASVPTWIFSNTNDIAIPFIHRQFPFFKNFDGYVLSYEHASMKPEPRIYEVVEEKTGCRGSQILYIDDRPENIEAGALRGWQCVLQEHPARTQDAVVARGLCEL